ncbi:MAG TPA: hypothetical protein VFZ34_22000, partial [Blastocatellia bacterium]|nr:hypothetical protein [Blastocatellia bacterium]
AHRIANCYIVKKTGDQQTARAKRYTVDCPVCGSFGGKRADGQAYLLHNTPQTGQSTATIAVSPNDLPQQFLV